VYLSRQALGKLDRYKEQFLAQYGLPKATRKLITHYRKYAVIDIQISAQNVSF